MARTDRALHPHMSDTPGTTAPELTVVQVVQPDPLLAELALGYTALFDASLPSEDIGVHPFEKKVGATT